MCGIAGWVDYEVNLTEKRDVLSKMKDRLIKRGPDEEGEWCTKKAGLVHRRLIVIDPEGGQQPMIRESDNNKYVMVYNGELYNTEDLRKKLITKGYNFHGHSDTEVLLFSYIEWGENCVKYLNGIFAFAVWDIKREKLFMARDRIGVKPLFYARTRSGFLFASEIKSLLCHPEINPVIDREGIAEVLAVGPGRTPGHGVFKDIKELKPAYSLTFDHQGIKKERYWRLVSRPHQDNIPDTIDRVRYLFKDTVKRQLVSDVPICTLLSGGLDSSAISAVASNELKHNGYECLHTFSVDYKDNNKYFKKNSFQPDIDNYWANKVSDFIGSKHHQIILNNKKLAEALRKAVYARDLPGMADIDVSLYLFCKEIKKDFVVAVSGECADEIFGGYPWYHKEDALYADTFPWSRRLNERISIFSKDINNKINLKEYVQMRYQEAKQEVPEFYQEGEKNTKTREMFYLNLTRWMPTLLDRKDRMSMYTGLEIRVPFCDHRLVEYVWNIPWEIKNYQGMRKGILREALKGILPEDVRKRPKNPYPKTFSPVYFQIVKDWLLDILSNPNSPIHDLLQEDKVRELTEHEGDFDLPWFGQLMRLPQLMAYLIQLNIWLEEYKIKIEL